VVRQQLGKVAVEAQALGEVGDELAVLVVAEVEVLQGALASLQRGVVAACGEEVVVGLLREAEDPIRPKAMMRTHSDRLELVLLLVRVRGELVLEATVFGELALEEGLECGGCDIMDGRDTQNGGADIVVGGETPRIGEELSTGGDEVVEALQTASELADGGRLLRVCVAAEESTRGRGGAGDGSLQLGLYVRSDADCKEGGRGEKVPRGTRASGALAPTR
jgi:hypothetical protein